MISLTRFVSSSLWLGPGLGKARSDGVMLLCKNCARTLRRSLSTRLPVAKGRSRVIVLEEEMTIDELAERMKISPKRTIEIIRSLDRKISEVHNKQLKQRNFPFTFFKRVVRKAGHTPQLASNLLKSQYRDPASLVPRPPVVTVMGHVDHGKTTLLDSLRQTSVAAQEVGGITQHIGAFSVKLRSGHQLTFLDTPGHAAFSNMRARGAGVTDIVVLVVAADDGVMEQTTESIQLVQQAKVPMVVAINKCDKHGVDTARIKRELLKHSVILEEFGGEVQSVEISALKGQGLEALEEAIHAQAELCDIRGDPKGQVEGTVIESKLDKGLGPTATVIVRHGTLTKGDILVAGQTWIKVRAMLNEQVKTVRSAPPSTPVVTVGWRELPSAGDKCLQAESEQQARVACDHWKDTLQDKRQQVATPFQATEREKEEAVEAGGTITVPLIVKGDVAGSVEALVDIIESRNPEKFELKILQSGVGAINASDVEMADSSKALIIGFNVSASKQIAAMAHSKDVTLLSHNIIYKLLDMLKDELASKLTPEWEEDVVGEAEVIKVFKLTGARSAAVGGCRVKQGKMIRKNTFRLIRGDEVIHQGSLIGMKHGRDDIEEARKDTECGLSFAKDPGFKEGDRIVCLNRRRVLPPLRWDLGF